MTLGDVVWVDFPTGGGRAQAGRRPGEDFLGSHLRIDPGFG